MKLVECYIENFGKLSHFSYHFNEGMNTFCHENGWGKSTFAGFIKAMFYGLTTNRSTDIQQNERMRYTPWQGGNFGGTLTFSVGEETYRVERFFGQKESQDTFALYDCKTGHKSDKYSEKLGEELFDIDAGGYERSTYISEKLTVDEKADYTGIQAKLVDMNDISDFNAAQKRLEERRKYYFLTGNRGAIAETTKTLSAKERNLEDAKEARKKTNEYNRRIREIEDERQNIEIQISNVRAQVNSTATVREEHALTAHKGSLEENLKKARERVASCRAYLSGNLPSPAALNEQAQNWRTITETRAPDIPVSHIPVWMPMTLLLLGLCALVAGVILVIVMSQPIFYALVAVGAIVMIVGIVLWYIRGAVKQTARSVRAARAEYDRLCASIDAFMQGFPIVLADTRHTNHGERLWAIRNKLGELADAEKDEKEADENIFKFRKTHPALFAESPQNENVEIIKAQAEQQIAELQEVSAKLRAEHNDLIRQTALLAGHAANYTAYEQEIVNLRELKTKQEKSLEIIQTTQQYLETARKALTSRYLTDIQQYFRSYMRILTEIDQDSKFSDEYESEAYTVTADFRVNITKFGKTRAASALSRGGRDLVALCLRFAITDALFDGKKPPLILDDPFINLDDDKITAAMALLNRVAEDRQIFYVSCHSSRA